MCQIHYGDRVKVLTGLFEPPHLSPATEFSRSYGDLGFEAEGAEINQAFVLGTELDNQWRMAEVKETNLVATG